MTRGLDYWGALILWLLGTSALAAAELRQAQLWTGAGETRLVLLLDAGLHPRLQARGTQLRLELPGLRATAALPPVQAQHPVLKRLRRQHESLVLELTQPLAPKSYTLPQANGRTKFVLELPHPPAALTRQTSTQQARQPPLRQPPVRQTPTAQPAQARPATRQAPIRPARLAPADTLRAELAAAGLLADATPTTPAPAVRPVPTAVRQPSARLTSTLPAGRDVIIAIDAGHGGKDPGAIGPGGTQEKTVTLAVARRLQTLLNAQPGLRAVLVRDGDYFIPLHQRVQRARTQKADLFISIHADAAPSDAARGASIYTLSERGASSTAAKWLADRENAADLIGGVSLDDKDTAVSKALLDLSQTGSRQASTRIAQVLLGQLDDVGAIHKQAVQSAGFAVLKAPDIPSILVETAFISTPQEERLLADPQHQAKLAQALAAGIVRHFRREPPPGTALAQRRKEPADTQANAADTLATTP